MGENVYCSVCDFDYTHILGIIQVEDDDNGKTKKIVINHEHTILAKINYSFRSQGNLHILFRCETGHFFIKSFDGHKGMVFVDDNPLMDGLSRHLNEVYKEQKELSLYIDFELLGNIEGFVRKSEVVA